MRSVLLLLTLAACDVVYSLDRPEPTQFCRQPTTAGARFCADFDDDNGTDPFAAFTTPDDPSRYSLDEDAAHSAPLGARLTLSGTGSLDARLQRLIDVETTFEASTWVRVTKLDPSLDQVKLIALHFGRFTGEYERVLYLTTEGNLVQKVGSTYPRVIQVDAIPVERWVRLALEINIDTATGRLRVEDDIAQFEFTPLASPSAADPVLLTVGPHDPQPISATFEVEMLYDDILVVSERR